jgi:O-antigen ligase
MTDLSPRERRLARIAAAHAARSRGIGLVGWLCGAALVLGAFAAAGAAYEPVVDFNMAHRMNIGLVRDPTSLIGSAASVVCLIVAIVAIAQGRFKPTWLNMTTIAYCAYGLISLTWGIFAIQAASIFLKGIVYIIAIPFCIQNLGVRRAANCVMFTLGVILVVSLILCLTNRRFATDGFNLDHLMYRKAYEVPGWRGLFVTKNFLAMFCAMTIFFILFNGGQFNIYAVSLPLLILAAFLLYMSKGKTSTTSTIAVIALWAILLVNRRVTKLDGRLPFLFVMLAAAVVVSLAVSGKILQHFDWTFTGRTTIWRGYWNLSLIRPWFGFGAGPTWQEDELFGDIRQNALGMTSTHDAYLGVLFTGGWVGVSLFAAWFAAVIQRIVSANQDRDRQAVVALALFGAALLAVFETDFSPNPAQSYSAFIIIFMLQALDVSAQSARSAIPDGEPSAPAPPPTPAVAGRPIRRPRPITPRPGLVRARPYRE